jgi:hypothetical protein
MKKKAFIVLVPVVCLFSSCLKEPDFDQLTYNFVVATNTAESASFSNYKTYYISDSVAYINSSPTDTVVDNAASQQLVDAVKSNMSSRGFTLVSKGAHPDLGLNMGVVKTVNASSVIYPGWWGGYPGWWDPWYWGWYYPYYYPWSVTYVITTGTIIVDMVDLKSAPADGKLGVLWSSVLGGAVATDLNTNVQLGVNAINQAFAQSPSVKTN